MPVAFDAAGTAQNNNAPAGANVDFTTLTIGPGLDRVLIAHTTYIASASQSSLTATWDPGGANQAMTLIREVNNASNPTYFLRIYGLVNPVPGNKTLRYSTTAACTGGFVTEAASFVGADQTGGATTFRNDNSATGTGTTASVTINSAVGEVVVAFHYNVSTPTSTNNTTIWTNSLGGSANYAAGASSVAMTATSGSSNFWASVGVSIKAAPSTEFGTLKGSLTGGANNTGTANDATGSVAVSPGDLVWGAMSEQGNLTAGAGNTFPTDNLGNTYAWVNAGSGTTSSLRACYSRVTIGGTLTVVHFPSSASFPTDDMAVVADVYAGPFANPPLDANPANGTADTTSPFTCPATGARAQAYELVACAVGRNGNSAFLAVTPNLKGAEKLQSANAGVTLGYQAVSATTTISPSFTGTNPTAIVLITASFMKDMTPVSGWQVQDPQPPHRGTERRVAGIMRGDDGTQYRLLAPALKEGWHIQSTQPPHPIRERASGIVGKSQFAIGQFTPAMAHIREWQPPYRKRSASIAMDGYDWNLEAAAPVIEPASFGFDRIPGITSAKRKQYNAIRGVSRFAVFPNLQSFDWEKMAGQPPRLRHDRSASFALGDSGTLENIAAPVVPVDDSWEVQPHQPQHVRTERSAGTMIGDDGTSDILRQFFDYGFSVRFPQPPAKLYRKMAAGSFNADASDQNDQPGIVSFYPIGWDVQMPPRPRAAPNARTLSTTRWDDGAYGSFLNYNFLSWENNERVRRIQPMRPGSIRQDDSEIHSKPILNPAGWEIQPPIFTAYPRMRAAATMRGDDGAQDVLRQWFVRGWEIQDPQPPHPAPERRSGFMKGDDGNQATIVRFFPYGWEVPSPQPPSFVSYPNVRAAGTLHGDDGNYATMPPVPFPNGWGVQEIQPPHPRPDQSVGTIRGEDGTQAALVNWLVRGWDVQDIQPPHPRRENSASLMPIETGTEAPVAIPPMWEGSQWQPSLTQRLRLAGTTLGDEGTQDVLRAWFVRGWEVQDHQPQRARWERSSSAMKGDDGINAEIVSPVVTVNWNDRTPGISSVKYRRLVPALTGDDGTQAPYSPPVPVTWAFDRVGVWRAQFQRAAAASGTSQFATFPNLQAFEWEALAWQPPHLRPEKSASLMIGDDGNQDIYVPPVLIPLEPVGWEMSPSWQAPHRSPEAKSAAAFGRSQFATFPDVVSFEFERPKLFYHRLNRWSATKGGTIFAIYPPFLTWAGDQNWKVPDRNPRKRHAAIPREVISPFAAAPVTFLSWDAPQQHRHPRPEIAGSLMPIEPGIEASLVLVPPPVQDQQGHVIPRWWRAAAMMRRDDWESPFAPSLTVALDAQWSPKFRWNRFDATARGDEGTQSSYLQWNIISWGVQEQPPHPRQERSGSVAQGDSGTQSGLINVIAGGWEVQSPQHQASLPRIRAAAVMRGDDGTQDIQRFWYVRGWEIQDSQPRHVRFERSAGIMPIETGTEATLSLPSLVFITESGNQQWRPPTLRWWRSASTMRGDDGNQFRFVVPFSEGWKIQDVQPPHPHPEYRAAGTMRGDDGAQFRYVIPLKEGWQVQDPQPPHPHPEIRSGGTMRGDEGIQYRFVIPFKEGWKIQDPQPPHPHPEFRAAGTMRGDEGNYDIIRTGIPILGFPIQFPQPPHPIPERRAGGTMRGDDGNQAIYVGLPPNPEGWQIQFPQPPHPRPERIGSVMPIEPGIAAPFIIGATGPTLTWDMFQPTSRAYARVAGALMRGIDFAQAGPAPVIFGWEFLSPVLAQRVSPRAAVVPAEFARLFIPLEVSPAAWAVDSTELIRPRRLLAAVDAAKLVPPLFPRVWGFDEPLAFLRRAKARTARGLQRHEIGIPFFAFVPWQEPIPIPLRFARRPSILGDLIVSSPSQPLFPFEEGWEPLLANPPHTRVERSGSFMLGDVSGTWGTLSIIILDPTKSTTSNSPVWLAVSFDIGLPPKG